MANSPKIAVIGSGVSGLTCATLLIEQGFSVTIFTREFISDTTSDRAAAMWTPCGESTADPNYRRSLISYDRFNALIRDGNNTISHTTLLLLSDKQNGSDWFPKEFHYGECVSSGFKPPFESGIRAPALLIESSRYLNYLQNFFLRAGGRFEQVSLNIPTEIPSAFQTIFNCSGLGARALANDNEVHSIRGQIIRIARPDDLTNEMIAIDSDGDFKCTYIIPRSTDCILGGTYEFNNEDL